LLLFFNVKFKPQVFEDVTRDVVLNKHYVGEFMIVMFSPKLSDVLKIDEVSLDTDHIATLAHLSGHNCANVEFLTDLTRIQRLSFVVGDHTSWDNSELR